MRANGPSRAARRGSPVLVLGAIIIGWALVRAMTWNTPFAHAPGWAVLPQPSASASETSESASASPRLQLPVTPPAFGDPGNWQPLPPPAAVPRAGEIPGASGKHPEVTAAFAPVPVRVAGGNAMLLAAGFANMPVPAPLIPLLAQRQPGTQAPSVPAAVPYIATHGDGEKARKRWSLDGWVLWRDDSTSSASSGSPSYGRSQAGAVARFALAPSSALQPQAYLRGSAALEGGRENEAALGFSARPLGRVPLRVAAEARLTERASGTEVRPAVYAVSELPPIDLQGKMRAEAYLQGGYVGGDFATPFIDGQARIDRSIAGSDNFDLRAGAGAWGGAQEDAARLDIGPSASVSFRLGEGTGRLAADYRFRVAGDAEPASGPALTLSAGF